jgi:hypothetical protein
MFDPDAMRAAAIGRGAGASGAGWGDSSICVATIKDLK